MRLNTCFTNVTGGYSKGEARKPCRRLRGKGGKGSSEGVGRDKAC